MRDNPLSVTHPELCKEWSERNFPFTPDDETEKSDSKVWWRGACGHEWQATIRNRAYGGHGCPYCTGHTVKVGFNDFASLHPDLVPEWSEKNGDLKPDMFTSHSRQRVIWRCENGHEWICAISNRTLGNGCPVCEKEPLITGVNDLKTCYPNLAQEWSAKNGDLQPNQIRAGYRKQVWWRCPVCKGDYQAQPMTRIRKSYCPYCSGKSVLQGYNDLATTHPAIAREWDVNENSLLPTDFTPNSTRTVFWRCQKGHSWSCRIRDRVEKGVNCPYCQGQAIPLEKKNVSKKRTPVKAENIPKEPQRKTLLLSDLGKTFGFGVSKDSAVSIPVYKGITQPKIPLEIWEKYTLSVTEAAAYFRIGVQKLRSIIKENPDADYLIWEATGIQIRREAFESYLNQQHSI